ncbi:MAG: serine/threonine protein kinase [Planctomycetota bacterium]|nr:MAG: serine/threonine protein kinase [Planctomycetota bacterium]
MLSRTQATAQDIDVIDDAMESHPTHADDQPRVGPVRFTYPSGARPLDGYTIKRGIGRGGFGEVYFAVSDGGKEVALKLIRHNLEIELRGVTHCLNLKHANLIALYDVKEDEQGNSWVVMEYAVGDSLEEIIDRYPEGLPPEEAFEWMQGIAAGVSYLHDHGIVHRDLKPGNIFRDDGQIKLGDYGLSKFISCSRRSGQTESIGTVHYMAPEVANGRYGKEIDIYALGIILYEMLTGQVPFEGESVGEVLMKHLTAEPSLDKVPEPYRAVIARALAKDPQTRFATVSEMFNALPPTAATIGYRPPIKETRYAHQADEAPQAASTPPGGAGSGGKAAAGATAAAAAMGAAAAAQAGSSAFDDEPVWRTIRDGWRGARDSWDGLNTPTKIVVAIVGCSALAYNAELVLQLIVPLVVLYVLYRIVRNVVLQHETRKAAPYAARGPGAAPAHSPARDAGLDTTTYQPAQAAMAAAEQAAARAAAMVPKSSGDWREASRRHWKKRGRRRWRESAAEALVVKPARQRIADLAGSMIMAAVIGTVMSLVAVLLRGETSIEKEQYAWLTITSVVGAWAVLIPAKFWEGTRGDQTLRRVTMLVIGLGVGAAAYGASELLMVSYTDSAELQHFSKFNLAEKFYDAGGAPQLGAFLAYFGALFVAIRWWKQADPMRRTRLSVWGVGACVLAAWVVDFLWRFPQPWGVMVAAIISTSVQLVSPHASPEQSSGDLAGRE